MNNYTIIAGINGTGKSSLRGVLEGQDVLLGHIIDPDVIAKKHNNNNIKAGKEAVAEISYCLKNNLSFTQETTLSGHRVLNTIRQARNQGYYVTMYYVGLSSLEESLSRIKNRVKKGGHDIPTQDVIRRYNKRMESLMCVVPLCDEITFYDNENGFVKVAEIKNNTFNYTNGYRPKWIKEVERSIKQIENK